MLAPAQADGGDSWLLRGLLPTALFAAITAALTGFSRKQFGLGRNECLQTVIVFLSVSFATLPFVGVFLRGEGMALTAPWGG